MSLPSASLVYNRLTFGPVPGDSLAPSDTSLNKWLSTQLGAAASDSPGVAATLAAVTLQFNGQDPTTGDAVAATQLPLSWLYSGEAALWTNLTSAGKDNAQIMRPAQEIQAASYIRAMQSPNQVAEQMVEFWHNHFNVQSDSHQQTGSTYPAFDQVLRNNALGNFRTLLGAVAKSAAMMYYLNQAQSTGSAPNENYAREVMELHTLGAARYLGLTTPAGAAGTGYSDTDVQQAAKVLSGWTIDGKTGAFLFNPKIHAAGAKILLGQTIPAGGQDEGETFFDILASHPGTANTIATKLYQRFIGDTPTVAGDAVPAMVKIYLANLKTPNQIALMLQGLILSKDFAASSGAKFKTPYEFIISLLRAVNVPINPKAALNSWVGQMGDPRFGWVPPNGRPDVAAPWMGNGALLDRWKLAEAILAVSSGVLTSATGGLFAIAANGTGSNPSPLTRPGQAVDRIMASMLPNLTSAQTLASRTALTAFANNSGVLGGKTALTNPTNLRNGLGMVIAAAAATSAFQFRG